ncbi:MAG: glutamate--tRNA ligase [Chloroflexi bacterium]|nr:MAG: glutamate--tRNA ligase [Chloroflexota bacterium]
MVRQPGGTSPDRPVRVRYAPSPTGYPHVGNIRTAMFNWLFARHHRGTFIVRIEDTDVERKVEGAVEDVLESLRWLGLEWDEGPEVGGRYGPYFQSQRLHYYRPVVEQLTSDGYAYPCYCSHERLEAMKAEQVRRGQPPGYDRRCRNLSQEERSRFEAEGIRPVIRFKTPLTGRTEFRDLIRGKVVFDNSTLDDFVLLKSDGYPTYHLANVVDDHLMEVSHVLRADEWLASTPRHILLYQAVGYESPQFAHLPMILGPDRSKLSKRHGATSLLEFRDEGYLPEAMLNFLALLGWSLDDRTEVLSREELVEHFSLERISKTAAIFNIDKLRWMNGLYLRKLDIDDLTERALPFFERDLPSSVRRPIDRSYVRAVVALEQERAKTLAELPQLGEFFFMEELDYPVDLLLQKLNREKASQALTTVSQKLGALGPFDHGSLEATLRPLASDLSLTTKELFSLLRVAVTGRTAAPPLFQTMEVLGKEACLRRIEAAIRLLRG